MTRYGVGQGARTVHLLAKARPRRKDFDDGLVVAHFKCGRFAVRGRIVDAPGDIPRCVGCFTPEVQRQKAHARQLTMAAVKQGLLTRMPCEECGNPKSEAHHEDYNQPLKVRWLCRRDHAAWHKALRDSFGVAS